MSVPPLITDTPPRTSGGRAHPLSSAVVGGREEYHLRRASDHFMESEKSWKLLNSSEGVRGNVGKIREPSLGVLEIPGQLYQQESRSQTFLSP
ncbi:hypothetical protein E2C01_056406 [Portunus trituberculatus]|uniref:Uncharacterized protein n=1 Tax=Portunus trituberculatus TaxID=210409 RepID=A0A5B7GU18_PORTR|nr:hypothetical protein [Portunus trituberculatus]